MADFPPFPNACHKMPLTGSATDSVRYLPPRFSWARAHLTERLDSIISPLHLRLPTSRAHPLQKENRLPSFQVHSNTLLRLNVAFPQETPAIHRRESLCCVQPDVDTRHDTTAGRQVMSRAFTARDYIAVPHVGSVTSRSIKQRQFPFFNPPH